MNGQLNWRAIGIAVAIGLAGSLVMGLLFRVFPFDASERPMWLFFVFSYGAGALLDIAVGGTAGALARVRGALHGLVAGAIATVLAPLIGFAMMWVETGGEVPLGLVEFYAGIAISGVVGIALATAAGAVATRIAAKHAATSA
jgi:hypothetical protein